MWTREEIKSYAKEFLKKNYWKAFLVCLITALLASGGSSGNNSFQESYYGDQSMALEYGNRAMGMVGGGLRSPLFLFTGGTIMLVALILMVFFVTVGFAIQVGQSRFFLDGFKGDVSVMKLFSTFNTQEYWLIVKTMFLTGLYTVLWSLLLIIPGIIKSYEYRFVPYILAEKPNLTANEVITRSREMTKGHKMDIFVLDLSFMGWYFLGALLFGIGIFFVNPYKAATEARLYNILAGNDELKDDQPKIDELEDDIFGDDFRLDF